MQNSQALWVVHAALFLVGAVYGANYNIAKLLIPEPLGPSAAIVLRVAFGVFAFGLLHLWRVRERVASLRDYLHLAACGFFGVAVNQLLFFKGLSMTSPVNASVIMTSTPLLVLGVSAVALREPVTWRKGLGLFLGLAGALLLIGTNGFSLEQEGLWGDLCVLGNALSYGTYLVIVKPLMRKYHALTVTRWAFTFALPMVLPFGLEGLQVADWGNFPPVAWWSLGFVLLGTTFTAYLLNAWALKRVNASLVGYYIYVQPLFATAIGLWLGQAEPTAWKALAASCIFLGVFLVSKKVSAKK
jgi:drug/metabolite transporter (DMT)-like permease